MGTLRITIELDTDAIEGNQGNYSERAAQQLVRAIKSDRAALPALWEFARPEDWTERPVTINRTGGGKETIGRILVDRSQTGWDA